MIHLAGQKIWERCLDDHHRAAWWAKIEGATEEGVKHFRWRGAEGPKKMDGELRLAWSTCRMCDVGHFSHTLPLCSLPRMDLWQVFPFRRPPGVSDSSKSRVRVVLFDTVPSVIRFGQYLAPGHSPSMGMGLAPKYQVSTSIYPKKILVEYPCGNPLGEA